MIGRLGAIAIAGLAVAGCRSTAARLDDLAQIHADDGTHESRIRSTSWLDLFERPIDSVLGTVNLAPKREPTYETIENPAAFCQEELLQIGGSAFDSPVQLGFAVALLSKIVARDRSHVCRAHALFSLRQIGLNWIDPVARRTPVDVSDLQAGTDAFHQIRAVHGDDGRHRPGFADAEARCLAAMEAAVPARYATAGEAREMLKLLCTLHGIESSARTRGAIEKGVPRLAAQVIVLTHVEALSDDRAYVRRDAAEGLGLLQSRDTAPALAAALSREKDSPEVRWAILRALARLRDPSMLPTILASATDENATTRECALQALKAITGKSLGADVEAWRTALDLPAPPKKSTEELRR